MCHHVTYQCPFSNVLYFCIRHYAYVSFTCLVINFDVSVSCCVMHMSPVYYSQLNHSILLPLYLKVLNLTVFMKLCLENSIHLAT